MKYVNIIFILTSILLILECVDITTTIILFSYGGYEINPFANPNNHIQFTFKITFPILLGVIAVLPIIIKPKNLTKNELKLFKRLMIITFAILTIFYTTVIINNIYWLNITNEVLF